MNEEIESLVWVHLAGAFDNAICIGGNAVVEDQYGGPIGHFEKEVCCLDHMQKCLEIRWTGEKSLENLLVTYC